jgi:GT2 family glycosyltransferase
LNENKGDNTMIPIIACTIGAPTIPLLRKSIECYAPDHELIVHENLGSSFGEAYNLALEKAFEKYDEVIISNDDVVLTPTTMTKLLADVEKLKQGVKDGKVQRLGFVGTMADNVRPSQNIRFPFIKDEQIVNSKWQSEDFIKLVPVIAPIFAWYSKEAFDLVRFPPINWFSDDVMCLDLEKLGFQNFVSSSYVHHVGSTTIGNDYEKLREEARPWIEANRPEYIQELYVNRLTGPENEQTNSNPVVSPLGRGPNGELHNPFNYRLKYGGK